MAFIKIRLLRLFTTLVVKTRKKRVIFVSEEMKTVNMLCARKKKEKNKLQNLQA